MTHLGQANSSQCCKDCSLSFARADDPKFAENMLHLKQRQGLIVRVCKTQVQEGGRSLTLALPCCTSTATISCTKLCRNGKRRAMISQSFSTKEAPQGTVLSTEAQATAFCTICDIRKFCSRAAPVWPARPYWEVPMASPIRPSTISLRYKLASLVREIAPLTEACICANRYTTGDTILSPLLRRYFLLATAVLGSPPSLCALQQTNLMMQHHLP